MSWKYFTSEELAQLLGISEEDFHRKVKRLIKRDFKEELDRMNVKNPDILLDKDNKIGLADPRDHNNFYGTDLEISSYI